MKSSIDQDNLYDFLKKQELALLSPWVRQSADQIAWYLSDDFLEFASTGLQYDKNDILDRLPQQHGITWTTSDFKTQQLSTTVVLITYTVHKYDVLTWLIKSSLRSSLWIQDGDNRKMIFHQGTLIPPDTSN